MQFTVKHVSTDCVMAWYELLEQYVPVLMADCLAFSLLVPHAFPRQKLRGNYY